MTKKNYKSSPQTFLTSPDGLFDGKKRALERFFCVVFKLTKG